MLLLDHDYQTAPPEPPDGWLRGLAFERIGPNFVSGHDRSLLLWSLLRMEYGPELAWAAS